MRANLYVVALLFCVLPACAKRNPWHDIDYSSVYRYYKNREIDSGYVPPSMGCMDEDLYNCK